MKLEIRINHTTGRWEVSEENQAEVFWSGELRREAVFYARDREDDTNDPVQDIVCYDRDGNISFGFKSSSVNA
jgi:hypothetical protein